MRQFDPDDWTRSFEQRIEAMKEQAEKAAEVLTSGDYTHSHRQGLVTVTVGASGNLMDAKFGARAEGVSAPQLSIAFMDTYREAVTESARRLQERLADIVGDGSELMDVLRTKVPLPETDR